MFDEAAKATIHQANHDLKNIITSIYAYGQVVKRRLEKGETETASEVMEKLNVEIKRLSDKLVLYTKLIGKLTDES